MASLPPPLLLHKPPNPTPSPPPHPHPHPHPHPTTRRTSLLLLTTTSLLLTAKSATAAFDFRLTVPDQTLEEAQSGIQSHAKNLLKVKDLLMAESWREAQKSMRRSSALLKQDIYTIIQQTKPAEERRRLRKLYSDLFNAVTRMDYAARDEDRVSVWECYRNIVLYVDDILSSV